MEQKKMEKNKMENKMDDKKKKVDKVIVNCVMDLYLNLSETKGIDGMENDFTDLFEKLLKINKKLCGKNDETSRLEASEYYHNAVNYYSDDEEEEEEEEEEDDEKDYHGIKFVDQK